MEYTVPKKTTMQIHNPSDSEYSFVMINKVEYEKLKDENRVLTEDYMKLLNFTIRLKDLMKSIEKN